MDSSNVILSMCTMRRGLACCLGRATAAQGGVFNIGCGRSRTVLSIAEEVARIVGKSSITPHVTGKYRAGDIRHCFADLALARSKLGYSPQVGFRQGLAESPSGSRTRSPKIALTTPPPNSNPED